MGNAQGQLGKTLTVGHQKVQLTKLLAEGGFSYVFLVKAKDGHNYALKRLLIQDRESKEAIEREVEVMRILTPHPNIVNFIDSSLTNSKTEKEVFILMEYCEGHTLVDLMNQRYTNRFSESEIYNIFIQICKAVAHMHSQNPPITHRDLKVENVLVTNNYKLCDFGSTTRFSYNPETKQEITALEEEIQKYTTLQYRAPEMCDLYSKKPVTYQTDIWALGCILYKLAYFKTPFEDEGNLAIINGKFLFPEDSQYSQTMKDTISFMLNPDPMERPNIFDVLDRVATVTGVSHGVSRKRLPYDKQTPMRTPTITTSPVKPQNPTPMKTPNVPQSPTTMRAPSVPQSPAPMLTPTTLFFDPIDTSPTISPPPSPSRGTPHSHFPDLLPDHSSPTPTRYARKPVVTRQISQEIFFDNSWNANFDDLPSLPSSTDHTPSHSRQSSIGLFDDFDPIPTSTPKKLTSFKSELRASAPDFPKLAPPPSSGKGHKRSMSANVRVNE